MEGTATITTNQYDVLKEKSISLDRILNDPKNLRVILTDRASHMFCSENVFTVINADEFINNLKKEYDRLTSENYILKSTKKSFSSDSLSLFNEISMLNSELTIIKSKWWYKFFNKS